MKSLEASPIGGALTLLALCSLSAVAQVGVLPSEVKVAAAPHQRESATDVPSFSGVSASPRRPDEAALRTSRHESAFPLYDVDEVGTVWALGETYKANFSATGATYIPFFGSPAPRNFPLALRTASITVAGSPLEFATEVIARRSGSTIAYDRGSVLENYAVARGGIEQSFVFSRLPERGEIVVAIDVESELTAHVEADGFHFGNELGYVNYGRAFALDAHGRRIEIETHLVDGRIEIVVPAEFAAAAALPLVIDPFITTFSVDTDVSSDVNPDVAVDSLTSDALVVYEYEFSATDHDVLGERYSNEVLQGFVGIDLSTNNWRAPSVAANRDGANWLCVAEVGTAPARIIRGRTIAQSNLALNAQFTITASEAGDRHSPDVGGDCHQVAAGAGRYYVVWERDVTATDTDIHSRVLESDGTLIGTAITTLVNTAGTLDTNPSISKTNGTGLGREWIIVFEREVGTNDHDILGARIHPNGVTRDALFTVASTTADERDPNASEPLDDHGAGRRWLAVYESDTNLRLRAFDDSSPLHSIDLTPAGPLGSLGEPDVTTDGRLWQITYRSSTILFPNTDSDVLAATVSSIAGGLTVGEGPVSIANSSTLDETRPRIASTLGSSNPYRCYVPYQTESAANLSDIRAGIYDSPINADDFGFCFGTVASCPCGNGGDGTSGCENSSGTGGAQLSAAGTWFVTSDTAVLTATQLPPGAPALYFQGTAANMTGAVFGDGLLCISGTITRMAVKFAVGSSSSFPAGADPALHVAGLVPAIGGYRFYQAWHRDSAPFCTSALFNLTNGVALLWAP